MPTLIFICTGNICRSPMAEYMLRSLLGSESEWTVESAGLLAANGVPASQAAIQVLAADEDIDLRPHRSRMLTPEMVAYADMLVCMSPTHKRHIVHLVPSAAEKTYILTEFDLQSEDPEIYDPIGHSVPIYRQIKNQIKSALPDLILHMKEV